MPETLQSLIFWFLSPLGRLVGAIALFLIIWAIKNIQWVKEKILTTKRRKLIATALISLLPAIIILIDSSIDAKEAWSTAITIFLSAMGIQGGKKALLNKIVILEEKKENDDDDKEIQPVVSSKDNK